MRWFKDDELAERDALVWLIEGVADLYPWLKYINTQLEDVLSNQDELDARSARIEAANTAIQSEVADLKAQIAAGASAAALDFSRLDAAVAGEEGLEPPAAPAPVTPITPVEDPTPVTPVDPTPVADPAPVDTPPADPAAVPPVVESPLPDPAAPAS